MYQVGDKIVCINNEILSIPSYGKTFKLTLYKIYEVSFYTNYVNEKGELKELVELVGIENNFYYTNRFIPLTEYRKMKIENILWKIKN